ncbi:MAG: restriction endonuclease subunit S [Acidimicrobiales bacterium]
MLPEGWRQPKLKSSGVSVIDGDRGKTYPNGDDFSDEGYCLFLSAKNVTKFGFAFDERQFISETKHLSLRKGAVLKGDIVLTTRGTVGNIGYLIDDKKFGAVRINSGMVVLRNANTNLDSDFLHLVLRSPLIEKQVKQMNFGSAQPQLTVQIINNFIIPLPPLSEQKKIAEILSTWDRAIEVTEKLIANARAQKKALMQHLLTGKNRLPGFKGEWSSYSFGKIAESEKRRIDPKSLTVSTKCIELEHIEAGTGALIGFCDARGQASLKSVFEPGHILYGKLRPYLRKFYRPDFSGVCSTEIWSIKAKSNICFPDFLYYLIQSPTFEEAVDVSSGSKMPRADWGIVRGTRFQLPKLVEQRAICDVLDTAESELGYSEQQLAKLRQEKSALMQQLLTGKRRVNIEEVVV